MSRRPTITAGATRSLALDVVVVVAFVAAGRRTHDESGTIAGVLGTAAPFLIGLALGWAAPAVHRRPTSLIAGLTLWASTLVVGMAVRSVVFGDGTALSFVVVATAFLGVFLVGWRSISGAVRRRSLTRPAT